MIIANVHDCLWFFAASRGREVATRREWTAGWEILAVQQTTKRPPGFTLRLIDTRHRTDETLGVRMTRLVEKSA